MFQTGSGVILDGPKPSAAVSRRIEWIARMSERRAVCLANRDVEGLRQLASEYAAHNMLRTANSVYLDVEGLETEQP